VFKGKDIASARYEDFPVRFTAPDRIQIDWTVVPRAQTLLDALTRHTLVRPAEAASKGFANLENLPRKQQEARLLELAESGDKIAAIAMARQLYAYDLTTAKRFVEELLNKPAQS
jgi:ribosomal protein L7/L12